MKQNFNTTELINFAGALSIGVIGFVGIYNIVKKDFNTNESINLNVKIEPEYYKKIYDIVIKESELDKDKYNRKPSKKVVIMCKCVCIYAIFGNGCCVRAWLRFNY